MLGKSSPSIHPLSWLFGAAPTLVAAGWPSLKRIMVGMPRTPYFEGASGFSSMLSLAIVTLPASSSEISSSAGPIILQGPHHSAQKSTSTGPSADITSEWKLLSVMVLVAMAKLLCFRRPM
jgi:hypothetical protein